MGKSRQPAFQVAPSDAQPTPQASPPRTPADELNDELYELINRHMGVVGPPVLAKYLLMGYVDVMNRHAEKVMVMVKEAVLLEAHAAAQREAERVGREVRADFKRQLSARSKKAPR